jgi:hypothetical protein
MTLVASRFHDGELLVQRRAGVTADAARLAGMLAHPDPGGRWGAFFAERRFAVLTARGADGRLWLAPLLGPAGFLRAQDGALAVNARPPAAGPLAFMAAGQDVGLIAVEFSTARRMRLNGRLSHVGPSGLLIEAEQVFGNCPAHIHKRSLTVAADASTESPAAVVAAEFSAEQWALIERSDTFFLGTVHPEHGADASHKGGQPGFVRVEPGELWWPDLVGNNMFNSLGNLAVNDEAALLFLDLTAGQALHVCGHAGLDWVRRGSPGDDDGTGRRVRFQVDRIVQHALPLWASDAGDGESDG